MIGMSRDGWLPPETYEDAKCVLKVAKHYMEEAPARKDEEHEKAWPFQQHFLYPKPNSSKALIIPYICIGRLQFWKTCSVR